MNILKTKIEKEENVKNVKKENVRKDIVNKITNKG